LSVFSRFHPRLQQAIVSRLGWTGLRPVQEQAGQALLGGLNAVVLAPTAGGKTEAALFPLISTLLDDEPDGLGLLYVAPIKALLNNQARRLATYTRMVALDRFVWHGDVSSHHRQGFLRAPRALLMTTPESLEVMLVSRRVDEQALFADLRVVVIDEIHAMAGTDRGAHLASVLERLARLSRHDVQRVGLSATVGNPEAIAAWLQGSSARPSKVVNPPAEPARRQLLVLHRPSLPDLATDAASLARGKKSLLFCQSRAVTEAVADRLQVMGTSIYVHHSAVSKEERERAEEQFHEGSDACIACTSTLELGIDVGDLDRVLQVEAPDSVSSFMQRMGRTGRREGQVANTTFLCGSEEGVLQAVALVELAREGWVEPVKLSDRCWPVLVHQLLAMCLAGDGVRRDEAWDQLRRVPDFAGIREAEFERLVRWMLRDRSLVKVAGRLSLGPKAERRFGRRNFMELYAVFSSPRTYEVETEAGAPVGNLYQGFVDRLVEGASCFLLGGRAWLVAQVRHGARRVVVAPAPRGRKPTWSSFLPRFLGFELCQRVEQVLRSGDTVPYLHRDAMQVLSEARDRFEDVFAQGGIEEGDDEVRWWTFAGGRVNATLRHALSAVNGSWKVVPDNFSVKLGGEGIGRRELERAIEQLAEVEFWEDEKLWREVAEGLPAYRLSKFQPLMPPWVEREVVASHLLDLEGAWRFVSGEDRAGLEAGLRRAVAGLDGPREPSAVEDETADQFPRPKLPIRWVDTAEGLAEVCAILAKEPVCGLDVETTLARHTLCLAQLAGREFVALIDALALSDLGHLEALLGDRAVVKVIHNASFERRVLGRLGIEIRNVVDTLQLSRQLRADAEGGHSLKAVCSRELGLTLDKSQQTSDWTRRPLTARQEAYAALDAEVLVRLWEVLGDGRGAVG